MVVKLFSSGSSSTAGLVTRAVVNPNVGPLVFEILSGDDIGVEVVARVLSHKDGVNPNG